MAEMELTDAREREQRRYQQIIERIKSLIVDGKLSPGDKLLPERQLAEILGVSRASVREALTVLQAMGVLEVTQGGGYYVREFSLSDLVQPFAMMAIQEQRDVADLLEVRKVLEVQAAELAATRAQATDLLLLGEDAQRFKVDIECDRNSDDSDSDFHAHLAAATHNRVLASVMSMLGTLYRETYGPTRFRLVTAGGPEYSADHFLIYEAIRDRDVSRARTAMASHIDRIISAYRALETTPGETAVASASDPIAKK